MISEKLQEQIKQHRKRWKEHPEECPAKINSMSMDEIINGIMNCTFLDTGIPGETKEEFTERLKNDKKDKSK